MFQVQFSTDNSAFKEHHHYEIVDILRRLARVVEAGETEGNIRDSNGNTIGAWTWEHDR